MPGPVVSTSLEHPRAAPTAARAHVVPSPRQLLWIAVVSAVAIGWTASGGGRSAAADADLARLLRAMVVLKAVLAAGALWLIDWRLKAAAPAAVALAYGTAAVLIAASPAVMWHLAHLIAGAALFHAGVGVLLLVGWRDGRVSRRPIR
jgi:hypothetical protein